MRAIESNRGCIHVSSSTESLWNTALESLNTGFLHFPTPRHTFLLGARSVEELAEGIAWVCFCYTDNLLLWDACKASVVGLKHTAHPLRQSAHFLIEHMPDSWRKCEQKWKGSRLEKIKEIFNEKNQGL